MNHSRMLTEIEYLNNLRENTVKAKNSLLKFEKDRNIVDNIIENVRNLFILKKKIK